MSQCAVGTKFAGSFTFFRYDEDNDLAPVGVVHLYIERGPGCMAVNIIHVTSVLCMNMSFVYYVVVQDLRDVHCSV